MRNLDFKTKLYLCIIGAVVEKEKKYTIKAVDEKVVYIFSNYDEFKNYFKKYKVDVENELIDLAICIESKTGAIVAFKLLCDYIITKLRKTNLDLTEDQIKDIHSRGKITPLEKVKEWESFELCAPGDAIGSVKDRCCFFGNNCHECLLEYASHQSEYDKIEFKVTNSFIDKKSPVLEKIRKG